MKNKNNPPSAEKKKVVIIGMLFLASAVIFLLGAAFCIFSLANDVSFTIMNFKVHGMIFGLVISFLGIRYFLSVRKLKPEVYGSSGFSWSNFKKSR